MSSSGGGLDIGWISCWRDGDADWERGRLIMSETGRRRILWICRYRRRRRCGRGLRLVSFLRIVLEGAKD